MWLKLQVFFCSKAVDNDYERLLKRHAHINLWKGYGEEGKTDNFLFQTLSMPPIAYKDFAIRTFNIRRLVDK